MNPSGVAGLRRMQLARSTWYRATPEGYAPLGFRHTSKAATRFGIARSRYFMLYFAADPKIALMEVEAVVATHNPPQTYRVGPGAYRLSPISVALNDVVDFGDPSCRSAMATSAQELTGDWRTRRPIAGCPPKVRSRASEAPTQQLGAALEALEPCIEGFLSPSAKDPTVSNLIVFPHRVHIDPSQFRITSRAESS